MKPQTIELTADKQCKNSVRYRADDMHSPVQTLYVMRIFATEMPERITVTLAYDFKGA